MGDDDRDRAFEAWLVGAEPRLRGALVAAYGPDVGRDATAEALAWAWEHWDRVAAMENPAGYLFRVAQSRSRRLRLRRPRAAFPAPTPSEPWIEPALPAALASLTESQRVAVVLVHGYEWTQVEVAAVLGVAPTTVQNHLERGLAKLRSHLEVEVDVAPR